MRTPLILTGVAIAACASLGGCATTSVSDTAAVDASRSLANRFQQELLQALTKALAEGGPVLAVRVCAMEAPAIAARLSGESGAVVRRTALKVRNPAASPDAHERSVLDSMTVAPLVDGAPREDAGWVDEGRAARFRYMRAIPTAPMCLTCHGETIDPALAAQIRETYPGDAATGFRTGALRGAFSIAWSRSALKAYLAGR